ncbi:F subunit of K+-transporting ATPase (Potass_KdpF) [Nocardioides alpinus]|uniref:F subunit of K+-transporting ATPase (Potass_KdpF) n=1 Tax=Nocardioides alpinus TaxID=748909 RepID=A0A1I0Z6G7_9ACTN|nr:potassium-transporting ATPase subunit F [Nocardioides alpinus]SFB21349.1 F subunit of K+-transporting ATPase (Potass_KdpF) [Nocardioides alpinus]
MSIESGLLVGAVIVIALYVLAALVFPERFS